MTKTIQERVTEFDKKYVVHCSDGDILDGMVDAKNVKKWLTQQLQEVHTQAVEEEKKKMLTILSKLREVDGDNRLKMVQEFMDNIYASTPSLTNKQNV